MIIGLTGYKGSGKSVVARRLSQHHGFVRRPFAYPLKAMVAALGVPAEILDGDDEAKSRPLACLGGRSARYALQKLGTEWGRSIMGESFWTDRWKDGATTYPDIVADDVRFPNEAYAIRDLGGVIIRVNRRQEVPQDTHASENPDAIPYNVMLYNDGTVEELHAQVDGLIGQLMGQTFGSDADVRAI